MIFAKKAKSDNIEGGLYQSDIYSYTYKKKVTLLVSKEWLSKDDKVLIIDDFMCSTAFENSIAQICEIRKININKKANYCLDINNYVNV